MTIDSRQLVYLISIDGGLRQVPMYLVDELKKKGWRSVINPKRTYYPEYDRTSPHYKAEEKEEVESDVLKVEIL